MTVHIQNHTQDIDVFGRNMFRLAPNRLTPDIGEVETEYLVSVDDVGVSDRTVF